MRAPAGGLSNSREKEGLVIAKNYNSAHGGARGWAGEGQEVLVFKTLGGRVDIYRLELKGGLK